MIPAHQCFGAVELRRVNLNIVFRLVEDLDLLRFQRMAEVIN